MSLPADAEVQQKVGIGKQTRYALKAPQARRARSFRICPSPPRSSGGWGGRGSGTKALTGTSANKPADFSQLV